MSTFRRGGLGLFCGMTPASDIALSPARAPGARPPGRAWAHGAAWERIFAVLGVCLPVPLLALTGLSIPLPAGVERIGAALVAWADPTVEGSDPLGLGDRGSIVLASGEGVVVLQAPSEREADTARRIALLSSADPASGGATDGGAAPKDGGGGGSGGSGGSGGGGGNGGSTSPPPDPGGNDPTPEPGPVEDTVNKVAEAPVVKEIDKTLDELVPTGEGDESSDGLLEDALPDLGL